MHLRVDLLKEGNKIDAFDVALDRAVEGVLDSTTQGVPKCTSKTHLRVNFQIYTKIHKNLHLSVYFVVNLKLRLSFT